MAGFAPPGPGGKPGPMRPQHNAPAPGSPHAHLDGPLRRSKVTVNVTACACVWGSPCIDAKGGVFVTSFGYHPMSGAYVPVPNTDLSLAEGIMTWVLSFALTVAWGIIVAWFW